MSWLSRCADLGGRLVGSLVPGRGFVRFDDVQLGDVSAARALAERLQDEKYIPSVPDDRLIAPVASATTGLR